MRSFFLYNVLLNICSDDAKRSHRLLLLVVLVVAEGGKEKLMLMLAAFDRDAYGLHDEQLS